MLEPEDSGAAVIVSSERLSRDPGWEVVPRNHAVLIGAGGAELRRLISWSVKCAQRFSPTSYCLGLSPTRA